MKRSGSAIRSVARVAAVVTSLAGVSGCVGGTTYGTGVSQEEQTLKDMYTMFNLQTEKPKIDYTPRPDLVVPTNKVALAEPVDIEATTSNPEWPETPEERIARVRAAAGEVNPRTGEVSVEERLRKKEGIALETGYAEKKFVVGQTDRDGNPLFNRGTEQEVNRQAILQRRAELNGQLGQQRKYLTEPPVSYRIPASTAPTGIEAYTEEERLAKEEAIRQAKAKAIRDLGGRN
jgi:hypothetical protein